MRFSELGLRRSPAHFTVSRAKKSMRSGRGRFRCNRASILRWLPPVLGVESEATSSLPVLGVEPDATSSLKEMGTVIIRPSNSGRATLMAVSMGPRPRELASQSASLPVLKMP